jgi:hypothetical protein
MKQTLLILAVVCGVAIAASGDCTFYGKASQADDQDGNYVYCDPDDPTQDITSSPGKLTVRVDGDVGECHTLEPERDDDYLLDTYGLELRPFYKGYFTQDDNDDWWFNLDQFGDENCAAIQRHIEMEWGEEQCTLAQDVSQGVAHDLYFDRTNTDCSSFAELSATAKANQAANGWTDVDNIFDPYPVLSQVANLTKNFTVDDHVLTVSFTQDEEFETSSSLCYGLGNQFAPPYHIPVIYQAEVNNETVWMQRNRIHYYTNGYLCGADCSDDLDAAYAQYDLILGATGSDQLATGAAALSFANSTCGTAPPYYLMEDFDDEDPEQAAYGGLTAEKFLQTLLIMFHGETKTCNECETYALDPAARSIRMVIPNLGPQLYAADPATYASMLTFYAGSRYVYCQTDMIMNAYLYLDPSNEDNFAFGDPSECDEDDGSSASALSFAFALVASVFVSMWR